MDKTLIKFIVQVRPIIKRFTLDALKIVNKVGCLLSKQRRKVQSPCCVYGDDKNINVFYGVMSNVPSPKGCLLQNIKKLVLTLGFAFFCMFQGCQSSMVQFTSC